MSYIQNVLTQKSSRQPLASLTSHLRRSDSAYPQCFDSEIVLTPLMEALKGSLFFNCLEAEKYKSVLCGSLESVNL